MRVLSNLLQKSEAAVDTFLDFNEVIMITLLNDFSILQYYYFNCGSEFTLRFILSSEFSRRAPGDLVDGGTRVACRVPLEATPR